MAVKFIPKQPTPSASAQLIAQGATPPWEGDTTAPPQTLLQALAEFDGKRRLFILQIGTGLELEVKSWDAATQMAVLMGPHNMRLNPKITSREDGKYVPLWR